MNHSSDNRIRQKIGVLMMLKFFARSLIFILIGTSFAVVQSQVDVCPEEPLTERLECLEKELAEQDKRIAELESGNHFAFSRTDGHITSLGKHSSVNLSVKKGDIVQANYTGTAENSEFYFKIVITQGNATTLLDSTQLVMNPNQRWQPIATQGLFLVNTDGELQLSIEFLKVDVSGTVKVFGSSLVAVKVSSATD